MLSIVCGALAVGCLLFLAALHVSWGLGGAWPAKTREELGPMCVGSAPAKPMQTSNACFGVASLLVTAAGLVAWSGFLDHTSWIPRIGSLGVLLVLLLRGIGGYADGWLRPSTRTQPFFRLNRIVYSPLCLALAGLIAVSSS